MKVRNLVALFLIAVVVTGCAKSVKVKKGSNDEKEIVAIQVAPVSVGDFYVQLKLSGTTESMQDVMVSAMQGGYVEALRADVGDWVNQGQVIAEISAAMAKAQYSAAAASMTSAKSNYDRQVALNAQDLTSAQLLETTRAQYEGARAQFEVARVNLDHSVIRAPFSGRIAARFSKSYEMAAPGAPIFNLVDSRQMKITVGVNEADIGQIRQGQTVTVDIQSLGRTFSGTVARVGVKADTMRHTFPVQVLFANADTAAPAGTVADVLISTSKYTNAVSVRQDYILQEGADSYVFVVSGNMAEKRKVEVGSRGPDDMFLIKSGLQPSENIVVEGQRTLKNGDAIRVISK